MTLARPTLLELGSDRRIRQHWLTYASFAHPAKLHLGLLQYLLDHYTVPGQTILDPMAGVGSILYAAAQQRHVVLREVEPRWLDLAQGNMERIQERAGLLAGSMQLAQHDAREPWGVSGDVVIFSPPYGCAFAATPTAKGMNAGQIRARLAKLGTGNYDPAWERMLRAYDTGATGVAGAYLAHYGMHPAQIGHWRGTRYWAAMTQIYRNARAALATGGLMILVLKDHVRCGRRVRVVDETVLRCEHLGFRLVDRVQRRVWPLSLWQRRRKERGEPIVEAEDALIFTALDHGVGVSSNVRTTRSFS